MNAAKQRRIDRFQASYRACLAERERAQRWNQADKVEAFGTAIALLDACICAEEGAQPFAEAADEQHVGRLREIAIARDLFRGERAETPAGETAESTA